MRFISNKILISLVVVGFVVFVPVKNVYAVVSWPDLVGFSYGEMLRRITDQIHGAIMGSLKQAAAEMINDTVDNMISGGSTNGALFISDWQDYLINDPERKASLYMNDFFSITTRGRYSRSNYISRCLGRSYSNYLVENARASLNLNSRSTRPQTNLEEYVCDGLDMFSNNSWKAYDAFVSNPANNPFGFTLMSQDAYQKKLADEQLKAQLKAESYDGFAGVTDESGDFVLTPGSVIKDIQSSTKQLPFDMVSNAQSVPEVITAVLTKIATGAIRTGIGNAQRNIQRDINNTTNNYSQGISDSVGTDPGIYFDPRY